MFIPIIVAAILVLDQLSKEAIRRFVMLNDAIPVLPNFFNITHVQNTGAAWGMFSGNSMTLAAIAGGAILMLCIYRRRIFMPGVRGDVVLACLLGGIIGNMIDRLRNHAVTDFLDFVFGSWHFPAFNVADIAICVGCALYIYFSIKDEMAGDSSEAENAAADK